MDKINKKYNLIIFLVWAVYFGLITVVFGLFLADAIDYYPCWWKAVIGIVGYLVAIAGTWYFGKCINIARDVELKEKK